MQKILANLRYGAVQAWTRNQSRQQPGLDEEDGTGQVPRDHSPEDNESFGVIGPNEVGGSIADVDPTWAVAEGDLELDASGPSGIENDLSSDSAHQISQKLQGTFISGRDINVTNTITGNTGDVGSNNLVVVLQSQAADSPFQRHQFETLLPYLTNFFENLEKKGGPKSVNQSNQVKKLRQDLVDLSTVLADLSSESNIKQILWNRDIQTRIQETCLNLTETAESLKLPDLDKKIHILLGEAKKSDTDWIQEAISSERSNQQFLEYMGLTKAELSEAMDAINNHLASTQDTSERKLLETLKQTLQTRFKAKPSQDYAEVTSLDVLIRYNRCLGKGGFAEVYEADWQGTIVAVKMVTYTTSSSVILRELEVWKSLRHPNILQLYGFCPSGAKPFYICALKVNRDALYYLKNNTAADRHKLIYEVVLGLAYLHNRSIIHGDLKAANILVDEHGVACLSDFGMTKIKANTTTTIIRDSSQSLSIGGSIRWMSPEQMYKGTINKATDIYSLAMTIHEIFSEEPPFDTMTEMAIFIAVTTSAHRPDRPNASTLSDKLWSLVVQCWSQEPTERPPISVVSAKISEELTNSPALLSQMVSWDKDGLRIMTTGRCVIRSAAFSRNGHRIAVGNGAGMLLLYSAITGELITSHTEKQESVLSIDFSPDDTRIVTGSHLGYIFLHESVGLEVLHKGMCASGNEWDWVHDVCYTPDGEKIVTGEMSGSVHVRDADRLAVERTFGGTWGAINRTLVTGDGKFVVAGFQSGTIAIWNYSDGTLHHLLRGDSSARGIACSPDGQSILATADVGRTRLWRMEDFHETGFLRYHGYFPVGWSAAFSPDSQYVACGGNDGAIYIWYPQDGNVHAFLGHEGVVWAIAVSPDGSVILSGGNDGYLCLWHSSKDDHSSVMGSDLEF